MNFYQGLRNISKTSFYTALFASSLTAFNCFGDKTNEEITPEKEVQEESSYSFSNFGKVELDRFRSYVAITSADFDGDGDLDIAVLDNGIHEKIIILENRIPQKTRLGSLDTKLEE